MVIDAIAEIGEALERTVGLSFEFDHIDGRVTHALQCAEAIQNGCVVHGGEGVHGPVDIWWQHGQVQVAALMNEFIDLVGVVHVGRQHGGHEFRLVV